MVDAERLLAILARITARAASLDSYAAADQQLRDAASAVRAWREQAARDADTEELADIFGADIA